MGATPRLECLGQPDPELEPERLGQLVVEERAEAATIDPAHHLADQVAVGERVVAVGDTGLPVGRLHLERVDHRLPRHHLVARQLGVDGGETGLVAEQPAHGDLLLARLAELGPVGDDRRVDVEQPALREQVGAGRGGALRRREHDLQGVVVVRRAGVVADTAPEVDDLGAVDVERVARPDLAVLLEVVRERVAYAFESRLDVSSDFDAHPGSPTSIGVLMSYTGPNIRRNSRSLP